MANTKSSEKRIRTSLKRRARNASVRTQVKTVVKATREAISGKDPSVASAALREATRALHKAASKGVLHPKNAARRIARLAQGVAAKVAKKG